MDTRYETDLEGVEWTSALLVVGMFQKAGKSVLFVKGVKYCAATRITKAVGGKGCSTVLRICGGRSGDYGHIHAKDCGSSWG